MSKQKISVFLCDMDTIFEDDDILHDKTTFDLFLENVNMIKNYRVKGNALLFFYTNRDVANLDDSSSYLNDFISNVYSSYLTDELCEVTYGGIVSDNKVYYNVRGIDPKGKIQYSHLSMDLKSYVYKLKDSYDISFSFLVTKGEYNDEFCSGCYVYPYESIRLIDFVDQYGSKTKKIGGQFENGK